MSRVTLHLRRGHFFVHIKYLSCAARLPPSFALRDGRQVGRCGKALCDLTGTRSVVDLTVISHPILIYIMQIWGQDLRFKSCACVTQTLLHFLMDFTRRWDELFDISFSTWWYFFGLLMLFFKFLLKFISIFSASCLGVRSNVNQVGLHLARGRRVLLFSVQNIPRAWHGSVKKRFISYIYFFLVQWFVAKSFYYMENNPELTSNVERKNKRVGLNIAKLFRMNSQKGSAEIWRSVVYHGVKSP